ncbi:MAG: 3-isopropylmalate dehydratase small subunit [Candidatus Brocadiales bacterium]|nr:3-isopropylmalate dehydratase small subunit [Candidatus Bathyanammoxibius amoris]
MRGRCWKFGDNISTDHIIAGKFLNTSDPAVLAAHCMEDARTEFPTEARPGDIVVAGNNFGCGSSREHAPIALKGCGIGAVIASTFARIFFRNAINIGLTIIESNQAAGEAEDGDDIEIDMDNSKIINHTRSKSYKFQPFPQEIRDIIASGGLMEYVKKKMGKA